MDFIAKVEHGGLEVEIRATSGEEGREELEEIASFLDEHGQQFREKEATDHQPNVSSRSDKIENSSQNPEGAQDQEMVKEPSLEPVSSKSGIPIEDLREIFIVEEDDSMPFIYLDDLQTLAENKTDRQRRGSLILLYLWETCYDKTRVKSSALKNALQMSSINDGGMANMYQGKGDSYFDRSGRGRSATVALTPPGKRQALAEIRDLIQRRNENTKQDNQSQDSDDNDTGLLDV